MLFWFFFPFWINMNILNTFMIGVYKYYQENKYQKRRVF